MKNFTIIITCLLILTITLSVSASVVFPGQESFPSQNQPATQNLVRAIEYQGTYIPVVDLPIIEIVYTNIPAQPVQAMKKNGGAIISVNLPLVEIVATTKSFNVLPAYFINGEVVAISNLPLIEITARYTYKPTITPGKAALTQIRIINLPEIIVRATPGGSLFISSYEHQSMMKTSFKLSINDLQSQVPSISAGSNYQYSFSNIDVEWIYVSLKNCGITKDSKIMCELARGAVN